MWKEKAYLVTANTHSFFFTPPLETPLSFSLSFHNLLLVLNIIHAEDPLLTFSKHLDHEQLCLWLYHHPRLMEVDHRHDIGKLKGIIIYISVHSKDVHSFSRLHIDAKISGDVFLSLDKDSLERYALSTEFQTPLMKIIEEVVCS